ncbi:hypothetical protein BGW36DRAFT_423202 [Talaromyces proteolyticus]|uniref:AMP-dependent synthetase/ligase domain-containing protein n=1 Tax=Talaromyces proteolyticus TaxID=1131652 RepID=A0AAD4KZV0_9EURO|nr:uncharacterized protein BGW36DRAFT_423202 [Talaromyces proteolyticus]KAH8703649.1 hypothetical protein BGW36DRAFT_423202 [Talaromyces proteolyticus]
MGSTSKFEPRMTALPPFSVPVANSPSIEGETVPRRNVDYKDQLLTRPEEGINTVFDLVGRAAKKFGDDRCMGWRDLVKVHTETTKVKKIVDGVETEVPKEWTYFELTGYKWISFKQYEEMVLQVGSGLRHLGLVKDDRVHLYAATSARWLATMHGSASQSMPIVTAYETLGEEGLRASILATRARAIFTDVRLLETLGNCLEGASIEFVIYNDDRATDTKEIDAFKTSYPSLRVLSFNELLELGQEQSFEPVPPHPEDLCCIMYTSGTTGTPKGVRLRHRNLIAGVAGADSIVGKHLGHQDTVIAYLPLAHIFELVFENVVLLWGAVLGFGHPRSLSDTAVRNCAGDIRELRPTLMVGVPTVWEAIMKGVTKKVAEGSIITRSGILDAIVFSKVAQATGGRLRLCMSGAGPIGRTTQKFISMVICPMIIGYGMTETSAMAGVTEPTRWTLDAIGDIPGTIEMKLVDFKEGGYLTSNNPPQGEIWIRGASVMEGYYENPEETAQTLTKDGWYNTGDIGEFDKNGHIRVIDRKKSLVKTMNGEYIALEKLESIYRTSPSVVNLCVYAAADKARPMVIAVPSDQALSDSKGNDNTLRRSILTDLQALGRKHGLASFEIVEAVVISHEPWTPENGMTTAAQKISRRKIEDTFKKDIDAAYAKIPK